MENKNVMVSQEKVENTQEKNKKSNPLYLYVLGGAFVVAAFVAAIVGGDVRGNSDTASQQAVIDDLCSDVKAGEFIKASSSDYITLVFDVTPTKAECSAFVKAASKLSKAVGKTENNLNELSEKNWKLGEICEAGGKNNPVVLKKGENIENVIIAAVLQPIDGENGALGSSSPCLFSGKLGLPMIGSITLDSADTALFDKHGKLDALILREMMIVLGFGVTWVPLPNANGGLVSNFSVLEDQVYTYNDKDELVAHPNNQPKFTGAAGVAEYSVLTGKQESYIPIQGLKLNGQVFFNATAGEGEGIVDAFLDKDTFDNALMTFEIELEDERSNPLTAVSLAMLRDTGYTVDTSVADEYVLPGDANKDGPGLRASPRKYYDLSKRVLERKNGKVIAPEAKIWNH
eukprot:snap_masked-scaffold_1-processed-gene-13.2-mRNA-1 protein AED:1.00 eAED:1.00 QI:0/0/0/0/1/1/2/0/401